MADDPKLLVVLEARLDKFEKQLKDAGLIAEDAMRDIEAKLSTTRLAGATAFGNIIAKGIEAAVKGAIEQIKEMVTETAKLGDTAEKTKVSFEQIQKIGFAAVAGGVPADDVFKGIESVGAKLSEMKQGETALSQLLDANNIKYRDRTGQIVAADKALELAAELMGRTDDAFEKIKIAQVFGLTKEWVGTLGEGVDAFQRMQAAAPDNLITQEQIEAARTLMRIVQFITAEFKNWGYAIAQDVLPWVQTIFNLFANIAVELDRIGKGGPLESKFRELATKWTEIAQFVNDAVDSANRPKITVTKTGVRFPGGDVQKDALDRQQDALNKTILLEQQRLETVGLTVGKQEEMRQLALLTAAAEKAGLDAKVAVTDEMKNQAAIAGMLKQQFAEAQGRLNELNSASKEFGSTLSAAFQELILQGKSFNDVLRNLTNRLASRAIDKLFDLFFATQPGGSTSIVGGLIQGLVKRQGGGPVTGGRPYLVGESGPELFMPRTSGMVIPNTGAMARGGWGGVAVSPVYNIDASGADVAAIERLQVALRATNASIEARALRAVNQHAQRYQ